MITNDQIRKLREEAIEAGDYAQADMCDRALSDQAVDHHGNRVAYADLTPEEARAECERALAACRAAQRPQL